MTQLTKHQLKKKAKGTCVSRRCTKPAARGNFCHSCAMKRYAHKNPEKYKWMVLRNNALRRGKEFTLTFEEFKEFLDENPDYMKKCGTSVKALQIDRIDVEKGYSKDNIQCITLQENVWKQHNVDYSDCPF